MDRELIIDLGGFELDEEVCNEMNSKARKGIQYFPYALGESNGTRQL